MNHQVSGETFRIAGRDVGLPVEVRRASNRVATFLVDADAAQELISPTRLGVLRLPRGRAMLILGHVAYSDTDLGSYNEFMVSLLVRHGSDRVAAYIRHLPVDDGFSCEAGRRIWGYPKTMATFATSREGGWTTCSLGQDGAEAVRLSIRDGGLPMPAQRTPPTYTFLDGVLRRTVWAGAPRGIRGRPGGARVSLGAGPIADDLRFLGLPKRALFSSSTRLMRARFGPAHVVEPATSTL